MADYDGDNALGDFVEDFNSAIDRLNSFILQAVTIAGIEIQKTARDLSPIDTGALRRSIGSTVSQIENGVRAVVQPTEPYASNIEFGQPPGTYVSPKALEAWARKRGLNPYAVSKSIMKKGTRAQPFLFPAFEARAGEVDRIVAQGIINCFNQTLK